MVGSEKARYRENAEPLSNEQLRKSRVEYWKASYDFQKHMMTVSLAAIAGFGALLGGAFDINVTNNWEGLEHVRQLDISAVFFGLLVSLFFSYIASGMARRSITTMPPRGADYRTPEHPFRWRLCVLSSGIGVGLAFVGLLVFVLVSIFSV